MAINAEQINVGLPPLPPVVKSDLQKLRESLTDSTNVKVFNTLSYEIGVVDPFKVKKKRSIEELILINELRQSNLESSQEDTIDEEDLLTLKQAREIARLEHELQQLNEYKAALDAAVVPELVQEIVRPDLPPDWTIDREAEGSFNKMRAKLDGIEINETYDKETPIFIVDRKVATDFEHIRNRFLVDDSANKFMSADEAEAYFHTKEIEEKANREAAIAAEYERLKAEHEAEVLRLARVKFEKDQKLKLIADERAKQLQEMIAAKEQEELDIRRLDIELKERLANEKAVVAKELEDKILSNVSGPQRAHFIKKVKSAVSQQVRLIEHKNSAFNSDMLSSYKD
jgi:hypothetical protein